MPPIRPRKVKLFLPALAGIVKEPLTRIQRVQALLERFALVWRLHRRATLRPLVFRCTVNLTELASETEKDTLVPTFDVTAGPDRAAWNTDGDIDEPERTGLVVSAVGVAVGAGVPVEVGAGPAPPPTDSAAGSANFWIRWLFLSAT